MENTLSKSRKIPNRVKFSTINVGIVIKLMMFIKILKEYKNFEPLNQLKTINRQVFILSNEQKYDF